MSKNTPATIEATSEEGQKKTIELMLVEKAKTGLPDEEIKSLMQLKIVDELDLENYKLVSDGLKKVNAHINTVDETRKFIKRVADNFSKTILSGVEPCQLHLKNEKQRIDNIKIEKEKEEERKRILRFNERTKILTDIGFLFNGETYTLPQTSHVIKPEQINTVSDDSFSKWTDKVKASEVERKEKEKQEKEKSNAALLKLAKYECIEKSEELKTKKDKGEIVDYTGPTVNESKTLEIGEVVLDFTVTYPSMEEKKDMVGNPVIKLDNKSIIDGPNELGKESGVAFKRSTPVLSANEICDKILAYLNSKEKISKAELIDYITGLKK